MVVHDMDFRDAPQVRRGDGLDSLRDLADVALDRAREVRCESRECRVARGFLVGSLIGTVVSAAAVLFFGERE